MLQRNRVKDISPALDSNKCANKERPQRHKEPGSLMTFICSFKEHILIHQLLF